MGKELQNFFLVECIWKGQPKKVRVLYAKEIKTPGVIVEYHGTREILWEPGETTLQG
jgi:hypothetical protein